MGRTAARDPCQSGPEEDARPANQSDPGHFRPASGEPERTGRARHRGQFRAVAADPGGIHDPGRDPPNHGHPAGRPTPLHLRPGDGARQPLGDPEPGPGQRTARPQDGHPKAVWGQHRRGVPAGCRRGRTTEPRFPPHPDFDDFRLRRLYRKSRRQRPQRRRVWVDPGGVRPASVPPEPAQHPGDRDCHSHIGHRDLRPDVLLRLHPQHGYLRRPCPGGGGAPR